MSETTPATPIMPSASEAIKTTEIKKKRPVGRPKSETTDWMDPEVRRQYGRDYYYKLKEAKQFMQMVKKGLAQQ